MKTSAQFLRFGLVGGLNTAIQYVVFIVLFRLAAVSMVAASAAGYLAGIVNSYFINRSWTFRMDRTRSGGEFVRFLLVNILAMGMNLLTLKLLVSRAGLSPEIAQVCAIGSSLVVNFAGNKLWTFRRAAGAARPAGNGVERD